MPRFDASLTERMPAQIEAQRLALAESWNQCFDERPCQLQPRECLPFDPAVQPDSLNQPGLVTLFEEGGAGAAVLIPAGCGLPAWYQTPTDSQKSRLDTLAMEWSLNLWPDDHSVERSGSLAVANLADYLARSQPATDATLLTVELLDEAGGVLGRLFVVWPLGTCVWALEAAPKAVAAPPAQKMALPPPAAPPAAAPVKRGSDPLARLRHLPVTISVRLAEKKMTLSQLLAITPGSLVTFNKSCDDLLDLYVNNSLYCRGEAVKIGESFGLKIDEVGVQVERESKLLHR